MDVSSALKASTLRLDASFAVANKSKELSEQIGEQFIEMLEKSAVPVAHPTLGNSIDIKA